MEKIYNPLFLLFLIIKIFLITNMPIDDKGYTMHDDYLMVNMAKNLIEGNWLGSFDQFTFIKGITYPVFLAINYKLHIPFYIANTILYFIACLLFVIAIKGIIKRNWYRVFIFFIMFFSPISYAIGTFQRAYRDDIYYSLILILISAYIGIYLRTKEKFEAKNWIIIASVSFTLAWFCREDTIWIIPFMVFFSIAICFRKTITIRNKIICVTMPYVFCIFCGILIGGINYFVYGIFAINDMQYSSYSKAYSSMTQIKTENNYKKVTLPKETIEKLYKECPSFLELKPYYNGVGDIYDGIGGGWLLASSEWNGKEVPENELGASHSMWAFRAAVSYMGYYESAKKADEYYKRLNNEINIAFNEGRLERKEGIRVPLFTTMNISDVYELMNTMKIVFNYIVKYHSAIDGNMIMSPEYYTRTSKDYQELYESILRGTVMPLLDGAYLKGWLVADDNLQLFIENNKNERIKEVTWLKSDDVRGYFEGQNIFYKQDSNARFDIYFKVEEKDKPYYLSLYKNGVKIKKISLREKDGIDNDLKIRWYFDNVNFVVNKTDGIDIVKYKVLFLQKMAVIYATLNNIVTYITLLIFIIIGIFTIKNKSANKTFLNAWIVLFILLIVFLLRIFTISYNTVTAFNSVFYWYLSPCYPILAAFNGLCLVYGIELLKRLRKEN